MLKMMCCEKQRVGRLAGQPCPNKATRWVNGRQVCGTHARLVPDTWRTVAAVGHKTGNGLAVSIRFNPHQFEMVRDMASDRHTSFAAMTRSLVDYALDELQMDAGANQLSGDELDEMMEPKDE